MKKDKSIVIGSGRLGSNIATLLSENGCDVIIIDKNSNAFRKLSESFSGYEVVGDATDMKILEDSYIKSACEVIITTDDDNINIFLAHTCFYIYNVPKIFVRLSDNGKSKLIDNTNIKFLFPFILSMNEFKRIKQEE